MYTFPEVGSMSMVYGLENCLLSINLVFTPVVKSSTLISFESSTPHSEYRIYILFPLLATLLAKQIWVTMSV